MRCVHFIGIHVVTALFCYPIAHGTEKSNNSDARLPEGVDSDENNRIEVTHRGKVINSTRTEKGHRPTITVTVSAFCNVFSIELKLNSFLFSADYIEKSFNESGAVYYHKVNYIEDNCFYLGEVKDEVSSSAAISTCHGIVGYFSVGNISYHIESQSDRLQGPHKVYKTRSDSKGIYKCGHDQIPLRTLLNPLSHSRRLKRSFLWPQDLDKQNKIVELYVANDNSQFKNQGSVAAVMQRTKDIVNIANAGFQSIGISLVLAGIEVWNVNDKISVSSNDKSATLADWADYRKRNINPITNNDNGVLITHNSFDSGTVLGYGYLGRMCTNAFSAALVGDAHSLVSVAGSVMDHEMGHSFGLQHDDQFTSCSCSDPTGKCIMIAAPDPAAPPTTWSQCSLDQFATSFLQGMDLCLYNVPKIIDPNTGYCGNGIVESGEQCDCGNSASQQCNRACCDVNTCQLIAPATCAFGRCCNINTCQIRPSGAVCRAKDDVNCDLEEFCDGVAGTCANDTYAADGTSCNTNGAAAYCYNGRCRNRESHCELIWGTGTLVSADYCYDLNVRGEYYGNCGLNWLPNTSYIPCQSSDTKCGLLQCQNSNLPLKTYQQFITGGQLAFPNGDSCHSVMFDFGLTTQDPGLVPDGAACGDGKMCINQTCVYARDVFTVKCANCQDNKTCNNIGQCQSTVAEPAMTDNSSTSVIGPSASKTDESVILSISLGVILGAMALTALTSLIFCACCCPEFFTHCCRSCCPLPAAKSTAQHSEQSLDYMPRQMAQIPMPSRMHWTPAANYFNAPPLRQEPFERPSEVYYPQKTPNWGAMQRTMPFWGNENNYRYRLYPNRQSNFQQGV